MSNMWQKCHVGLQQGFMRTQRKFFDCTSLFITDGAEESELPQETNSTHCGQGTLKTQGQPLIAVTTEPNFKSPTSRYFLLAHPVS